MLALDQVRVTALDWAAIEAEEESVRVGAGGAVTVTSTEAGVVPPTPVQLKV